MYAGGPYGNPYGQFSGGQDASVNSPVLPYNGPIQGGMSQGKKVIIQGFIPHEAKTGFIVNLHGGYPDQDIGFHFNPRFGQGLFASNKIVRNHLLNGHWGPEEADGDFPFKKGATFELTFQASDAGYEVQVNQQPLLNYGHRVPVEMMNSIQVNGDVQVNFIRYEGGRVQVNNEPLLIYAHRMPMELIHSIQLDGDVAINFVRYEGGSAVHLPPGFELPRVDYDQPQYNMQVPHCEPIMGGMYPGRMVFIGAAMVGGGSGFILNLACGSTLDIALHFNPRVNDNKIVLNSQIGGDWGKEVNLTKIPFVPNRHFDICIFCDVDRFKIAVNNEHLTEFRHRIPNLNVIDQVQVQGQVRLGHVRVQ